MPTLLRDVELLARLVSFDTTSGGDAAPIVEFALEYLDAPGVRAERVDGPDGAPPTVVAMVGPRDGECVQEGLTLSGHLDVVPATEPEWRSDPFRLTDAGDDLVGRGACDMKGFCAIALNLLREAGARAGQMRRALCGIFTLDEELGAIGASGFAHAWDRARVLPRSVIIGEPTDLRVVRMHKGHLKMRATVTGRSAHSGYPALGANAIEPAARVVDALAALRAELENERAATSAFFPDVPHVTLNVGRIAGGGALNVVPDRCVVEFGLRLLPGMESGPFVERARRAAEGAVLGGQVSCSVATINDNPPMLLAEDARIHRELCALVAQRETAAVSFASDAGWLQTMGMECALFGPGSMAVAHKPNERIGRGEMARGRELLESVVGRFVDG